MTGAILRELLVLLIAFLIGTWLSWWLGALGTVAGALFGCGLGYFTFSWVLAPLKRESQS